MTKPEAKNRIGKLKETINRYRYLYHVLDKQEISDSALDSLKKELFDLEQQFPEFISDDSPTQRVGGKPLAKFEKVKHPKPMISLNDAFSGKDMEDWQKRNINLLSEEEISGIDYYCEPKLDGLAIELIYEKGILKVGSTRGDGLLGENVTQNLRTIEAIPLVLQKPVDAIARGEVIITKADFEKINKEQKKMGLSAFANPRNLAAGSIRQLDSKIAQKRRLDANAYVLLSDFGQKTHEQAHQILHDFGFKTNNKYNKHCKNLEEVIKFHEYWYKNRGKLPYEIDGIVVQINDNKIMDKLGVVGKAPRGAIAFKFPLKQATTVVEDILVQVGRTGVITPIAVLSPTEVGGVTITRATLHNIDEINRLGLRIGDTVIVGRAGDVIPDIIKVLSEMRTGKEKDFKMPETCPSCGKKLVRPGKEVLWRCQNRNCPAQHRESFYHFVSVFDIVGLGPKIIDRLLDEGIISDAADLFVLKEDDVRHLERFAEKSSQNLVSAIQAKKKISLAKLIYSLGIRNVGEETAQDLAERFISLSNLKQAVLEDLQGIEGVGPVVSCSIYNYFKQIRNIKFIEKLKKVGVDVVDFSADNFLIKQKLKGMVFVLTGSLEMLARDDAKEKIRSLGGEVSESVSKNTSFLVAGKDPGSKFHKAKELDVKIINEKEFLGMLE
jgi:DNA ligase (NAD+)